MPKVITVTIAMAKQALDVVCPGKKILIKDDVEPQSEIEEAKE